MFFLFEIRCLKNFQLKQKSYNKQITYYAEIQEKFIHLTHLYDTETKSKWQYLSQIEELSNEVKQLRDEVEIFSLFLFYHHYNKNNGS